MGSKGDKGVLVCGSGIGISISANKFKGIRCAQVQDTYNARVAAEVTTLYNRWAVMSLRSEGESLDNNLPTI